MTTVGAQRHHLTLNLPTTYEVVLTLSLSSSRKPDVLATLKAAEADATRLKAIINDDGSLVEFEDYVGILEDAMHHLNIAPKVAEQMDALQRDVTRLSSLLAQCESAPIHPIDLVADGKFLANCIKESKMTNADKLDRMTQDVMKRISPWLAPGAEVYMADIQEPIKRALDSAVSMGGWEKKPTTPNRDNTLAQRLCHEETGLMGDPETAEKVAAWVLLHYTVKDRQS